MSNNYLKELYGPGGTFYHGRNLGITGADASYSSYGSNKKAYPPHNSEEEEEEDMSDDILNFRQKNRSGYELEKTVNSLNESMGSSIETLLTDVLTGLADEFTGEAGGIVLAIPAMVKNLIEVYQVGGEIDEIFEKAKIENQDVDVETYMFDAANISELKTLARQQSADVVEFFSGLVRALPIPAGFDSTLAGFMNQISSPLAGGFSSAYQSVMGKFPSSIRAVIEMGSAPVGGPIIYSAFRRIYKIANLNVGENYFDNSGNVINQNRIQDQSSEYATIPVRNLDMSNTNNIDMSNIPSESEFKSMLDQAFSQSISESLKNKSLAILLEGLDEESKKESHCNECGMSGGMHEAHCGMHEDDDNVSEMNAGGVPGVAVPVGNNPDGTPTTYAQLKKLRKKQDIYQITENQNWNHSTLGKIKFK